MGKTTLQTLMASSVNLDNPTPEETVKQQETVEGILLGQIYSDYIEAGGGSIAKPEEAKNKAYTYWEGMARIILPRFQSGMTAKNIKYRLRASRKLGFKVKSETSKMNQNDLINYYLNEVRQDVYEGAREYCPEVVSEILAWNKAKKEESQKHWMRH